MNIYRVTVRSINKTNASSMQIVNWRTHLKFPEEAKLSLEAKDLMSKLLCNVDQRLGTRGAHEIKVHIPFCCILQYCLSYEYFWVSKNKFRV